MIGQLGAGAGAGQMRRAMEDMRQIMVMAVEIRRHAMALQDRIERGHQFR